MLWAQVPARTLAQTAPCPPQARTGAPPPPVRQESRTRPGGWLARESRRKAHRQRNRVGHRLFPKATLTFAWPSRGIPSHLHRNVRDPSGSGSRPSLARGWNVGMKWGGFCEEGADLPGCGRGIVPILRTARHHHLPLRERGSRFTPTRRLVMATFGPMQTFVPGATYVRSQPEAEAT